MRALTCPHCHHTISIADNWDGDSIFCLNCKTVRYLNEARNAFIEDFEQSENNEPRYVKHRYGKRLTKNDLTPSNSNIGVTIATILSLLLLVAVIIYNLNPKHDTSNSNKINSTGQNEMQNDAPDEMGAYIISQNFVKDNIVSPSTAEFPIEPTNIKRRGDKFIIISYLDAQNTYGAKIREKYLCLLIYNGGEWSHKLNWTLEALQIGDELAYYDKSKTEHEIANDINAMR